MWCSDTVLTDRWKDRQMSNARDSNVFCRLFAYRPRPDRTSVEDFLTEAYASVLLSDTTAAARVLTHLFRLPISPTFTLRTQQQYEGDRPDMEFRDDKYLIFQENKVGSPFDQMQIDRYQERIATRACGLGLVTKVVSCLRRLDDAFTDMPPCEVICWSDVYRAMKDHAETVDDKARALWDAYLGFLEELRMDPFAGFEEKWLIALRDVDNLRNRAWQLLDLMKEHLQRAYRLTVENRKASDGKSSVHSGVFDAGGLKLQPVIDFNSAEILFELWLYESQGVAFGEVKKIVMPPFHEAWNHLVVRSTPEGLLQDFYDCIGDRQVEAVNAWIDLMLSPLVRAGLVNRRIPADQT